MGSDSCTKETVYGMGPWLGKFKNFTVVDTPGFGDSDGEDDDLLEEMMDVLKNSIGYTHSILLLISGETTRFSESLQSMLRQMNAMFGDQWWQFMTIGVSFWPYDQASIEERTKLCTNYPDRCRDEAWFANEWNGQFRETFHLEKNFTFVFTDSFSQIKENVNDSLQEYFWHRETQKLWDIATSVNEGFEFRTVDDILEENEAMKAEIKWLNDVITNNISELAKDIAANAEAMDFSLAPIGSIVGWHGGPYVPLPEGWQHCDGSLIRSGTMAGQTTPDLNRDGYFLRGGTTSGTFQDDQLQSHSHAVSDPGHTHSDNGHSHGYKDRYKYGNHGDDSKDIHAIDHERDEQRTSDTAKADITSEVTGVAVTEVTGAHVGEETRPRNMAVEWIIRIE